MTATMAQVSAELSADELALYDRQLRVWGAEGQNRIKQSAVLVLGLNGVGTEVVKNLVLAGVGSLEVQDDSLLQEEQLSCQFFSSEEDVGSLKLPAAATRIRDLNPRVNLTTNTNALDLADEEYFSRFNLVIANTLNGAQLVQLNEITRKLGISLHVTVCHGLYGYIFNDLVLDVTTYTRTKMPIGRKVGKLSSNREIVSVETEVNHEEKKVNETFTVKSNYKALKELKSSTNLSILTKRQRKNLSPYLPVFLGLIELEIANKEINLSSLKEETNRVVAGFGINEISDDSIYERLLNQLNTEISPAVAILGGTLAQDVINFLSKKELPINNLLIFDGDKFTMPIYEL
jgi:ubiquitin-like 1-activating enzyme E1 A